MIFYPVQPPVFGRQPLADVPVQPLSYGTKTSRYRNQMVLALRVGGSVVLHLYADPGISQLGLSFYGSREVKPGLVYAEIGPRNWSAAMTKSW